MTIFRVLNEVITDIDELLERDAYQNHIEKIKTIQSTFMGASGLQLSRSTNSDRSVKSQKVPLTLGNMIYEL